jgi:hypothetical protein
MILSHTHKFIFLCNGKTGTSSIESVLQPYQEGEEFEVGIDGLYTPKHVPPATLRSQLGPKIWDDYFTFTFVRNPWDWFVSQYFWNHDPDPISKKKLVREPIATFREYQKKQNEQSRLKTLERFTDRDIHATYKLLRRYRGIYEADSLFQYNYVYSAGGKKLIDFVGRFERITDDFQQIAERIGIDVHLPHWNATAHRSYQSYYTDETSRLIHDLYEIDIDAFGYTFSGSDSSPAT